MPRLQCAAGCSAASSIDEAHVQGLPEQHALVGLEVHLGVVLGLLCVLLPRISHLPAVQAVMHIIQKCEIHPSMLLGGQLGCNVCNASCVMHGYMVCGSACMYGASKLSLHSFHSLKLNVGEVGKHAVCC